MRADSMSTLTADGPGRKSNHITIKSNKQYNTHVAVFDIRHMPQGCATWPAVWETDDRVGTSAGEIDILEGVNDLGQNSVTLHTEGDCTVPVNRTHLGTSLSEDCSSDTDIGNGNNGCSVEAPYASSVGPGFNANGGGYYAAERTPEYISGTPIAHFPSTSCDVGKLFGNHNIIVDLSFCGDWAGKDFSKAGCDSDCAQYVNENPAAFEDAYWDFAAVRVYESASATTDPEAIESARASSSALGRLASIFTSPTLIALAVVGGAWGLA